VGGRHAHIDHGKVRDMLGHGTAQPDRVIHRSHNFMASVRKEPGQTLAKQRLVFGND